MLNVFHTQTKIIFTLNLDRHLQTWINKSLRTHHMHWFPPLSDLTSTKPLSDLTSTKPLSDLTSTNFLAVISQTYCHMTPLIVQDIYNRFVFCFKCTAIHLEIQNDPMSSRRNGHKLLKLNGNNYFPWNENIPEKHCTWATLKEEAASSSTTLAPINQPTWHHVLEDGTLH